MIGEPAAGPSAGGHRPTPGLRGPLPSRRRGRACTAAQPSATTTANDQPCQAGGGFRRCANLDHDDAAAGGLGVLSPPVGAEVARRAGVVLDRTRALCPVAMATGTGGEVRGGHTRRGWLCAACGSAGGPVYCGACAAGVLGSNRGNNSGRRSPAAASTRPSKHTRHRPAPHRPGRPAQWPGVPSGRGGRRAVGCRPAPGALRCARRRDDRGSSQRPAWAHGAPPRTPRGLPAPGPPRPRTARALRPQRLSSNPADESGLRPTRADESGFRPTGADPPAVRPNPHSVLTVA